MAERGRTSRSKGTKAEVGGFGGAQGSKVMTGDGKRNGVWAWFEIVVKIAQILIIPLAIWIISIERRLTQIESNRFDSHQAQEVYRELGRKADLNDVPPPWFIERVNRLEARIQRIEDR